MMKIADDLQTRKRAGVGVRHTRTHSFQSDGGLSAASDASNDSEVLGITDDCLSNIAHLRLA